MLDDEDAMNDVNPFVLRDFSLPGSVRQTGRFSDFQEVPPSVGLPDKEKSVYCSYGLCADEKKPCRLRKEVQPRRNIDHGVTCGGGGQEDVKVGVSSHESTYWYVVLFLILLVAVLV